MSPALLASCWPIADAAAALAALAAAGKLPHTLAASAGRVPQGVLRDRALLEQWLEAATARLGLEAEPLRIGYDAVEDAVRGPALLRLGDFVVAVVRRQGARVLTVAPSGSQGRVLVSELAAALRAGAEPDTESRVDALLATAEVPVARRARAREALLNQHLARYPLDVGWSLALPPGAAFGKQASEVRLPQRIAAIVATHVAMQVLSLLAWWLIGRGALEGRLEVGWLFAWGLLLVTSIPLRYAATWSQGTSALSFGVLLKRRLLLGALNLNPDESRKEGAGALLGRTLESEAVESLATSGALASLLAVVELAVSAAILALGPGGVLTTALLLVWVAATLVASWVYLVRLRAWATARVTMTNDLVERMIGHRTRLAQEPRAEWHTAEDEQLSAYATRSESLDRVATWLTAVVPRGWLVLGMLVVAAGFVSGDRSPAALAVWLGGVLLAYRALAKLTVGINSLLGASVAWTQTAPLFHAAARTELGDAAALESMAATDGVDGAPLIEARDLYFRQPTRREPILRGLNLRIAAKDRLLLQGPSGGGKSTLGAVLSGLRTAGSGVLLLHGLDHHTLGGDGWRRRVVAAPQFHENHVVSATFAFNLLMGRAWPPRQDDLTEAMAICSELGLGPVIARMPGGLMQMVGETGWQLSHGERSRLFIARALLQRADMMVLDESFAALDPETLEKALRCVLARAPALLVIAHP